MSLDVETHPTISDAIKAGSARRGIYRLLGEEPAKITLDRAHFPGKRPLQLQFSATLRSGAVAQVLAEYGGGDASDRAAQATASLMKSRNGQRTGLMRTPLVADSATGLVFRRPGLDERLPGLRLLHDAAFAQQVIARQAGQNPGPVSVHLMAHRLGKRAVLRMSFGAGQVYARLRSIKSGEGTSRFTRHRYLWETLGREDAFSVPEPLGEMPELGLSLIAELPGVQPDFGETGTVQVLARALRALRALTIDALPTHTGQDEARILGEWFARCEVYCPDVAQALGNSVAEVADRLSSRTTDLTPCHRDLHEKQILIAGNRVGFLDFDTLSLADPALDPGNLLAHVFLAGQPETPLATALDMPGLALWRRAALLRLAMIYAFTSMPYSTLNRLIREACRDDRH